MKILLLNQCFWPDVAATAQHLSDLAAGLAERGHEVTVICADRGYDDQQEIFPANERWQGVEIIRVRSIRAHKKRRWQRALNFGSFLLACAAHLLFLPRQDVVIALTSPPLISWLAAWFTRLRGGRLIFWVMDLNPDEAIAAGWLPPNSPITKLLERFLATSLTRSEKIVVLDRFVKQRIVSKGVPPEKIHIVPPWPLNDMVGFSRPGREQFRAAHGLQNKFVVMYAGNHSPCNPLSTLLQAVERLRQNEDIAFCFVGGGSEFAGVKQFADQHDLPNVTCLPYQPRTQLPAVLSAGDLHVAIIGEQFVGIIHPSKIYNVMKVGSPFLYVGPSQSHVTDIVSKLNGAARAYVSQHGDVDEVVRQILLAQAECSSSMERMIFPMRTGNGLAEMLKLVETASCSNSAAGQSLPTTGSRAQASAGWPDTSTY